MIYLNNPWKPVRHTFIKDSALTDKIQENGYAVVDFINEEQLNALQNLYEQTHQITDSNGGMFYSVYSQDIAYRKNIHQQISKILESSFLAFFEHYRVVMNSYVIKASGPKSEFYVHQDSTGLDETIASPLSLWIPLHDITAENGAMCMMKKSHKLFSPYRGISIRAPFDGIHNAVKKYLEPVFLKAGQAILFDNRTVHNSLQNNSGKNRVVITTGIFPEQAKLISCFQQSADSDIEIIEQQDSYLMDYPKFLNGCFDKPNVGKTIGFVKNIYPEITELQLDELCHANNIVPVHLINEKSVVECNMIAEPIAI